MAALKTWSADRVSICLPSERKWGVFCCIELLEMCCLVCLNMMSSVKDMLAEVDFNKWGQSTASHPLPLHLCLSVCDFSPFTHLSGLHVFGKWGETSCSHKNDTRLTKNLSRAKRRSHGNNDNHSQLLTWTWNMALLNQTQTCRGASEFQGFFFLFFFWRYHFHWSRKTCQRNLQPSLHSQGQTCQRDARILAPHCTHFDIKCQLFHHMNICRAGLCAPDSDQSYSGCKKKKKEGRVPEMWLQMYSWCSHQSKPTRPFLWVQTLASQGGMDIFPARYWWLYPPSVSSPHPVCGKMAWVTFRAAALCVSGRGEKHRSLFAWVVSKMLRI